MKQFYAQIAEIQFRVLEVAMETIISIINSIVPLVIGIIFILVFWGRLYAQNSIVLDDYLNDFRLDYANINSTIIMFQNENYLTQEQIMNVSTFISEELIEANAKYDEIIVNQEYINTSFSEFSTNITEEVALFRQEQFNLNVNLTIELEEFKRQQDELINHSNELLESIKTELEGLRQKILDVITETTFVMNIAEANVVDATLDLCEYDPLGVGPIECEGGEFLELESNAVSLKPLDERTNVH